jgi:hypothetical protein
VFEGKLRSGKYSSSSCLRDGTGEGGLGLMRSLRGRCGWKVPSSSSKIRSLARRVVEGRVVLLARVTLGRRTLLDDCEAVQRRGTWDPDAAGIFLTMYVILL